MKDKNGMGHLAALFTIVVWGTTFISTKVLLRNFQPVEILIIRFVIGYILLFLAKPGLIRLTDRKQEWVFAAAGLCGICLYYLLENIALTYTLASNVGVIISAAPFFTAILSKIFLKEDGHMRVSFFLGFAVAIVGICMMSFSGSETLKLNPKGDILALAAAFVWACYSVLTKKISGYGYSTIQNTRHMFGYGILFMIPAAVAFDFRLGLSRLADPVNLLNILFLGAGASALCFVTWNMAVQILGAVRTSVYIYIVPVVTIVTSVLILHEKITGTAALGAGLTLAGLILSEGKIEFRKERESAL
ncbi:DMT family transporter [Clostridium sp. AF19-22AC]|jgi:drug/metabolite transporter (DMT)-like permease|uniref:Drug/metabolite transporter (DMT)-like permease n=1 Tax=Faecalicatena orotica TaxID=1544 RepID=A0A2Y9B927_9FIRM|nr:MULTISPECIES: DMT family transporter [Clostridia]PWJ32187.1 drug/metabolite transporter (DMT)-like permease [Faecalicatena orotica]RHR32033.1 DMT family transporter [Clostridium sp. AF19-22AC]SSA54020.1 Permease of the drug/metabolite transporter (DMT) superfamily [Faecalicatena orotica]